MALSIHIESGVPFPEKTQLRGRYAALMSMEVGQSFVDSGDDASCRAAISRVHKTTDRKFTARRIDETSLRVWRIK